MTHGSTKDDRSTERIYRFRITDGRYAGPLEPGDETEAETPDQEARNQEAHDKEEADAAESLAQVLANALAKEEGTAEEGIAGGEAEDGATAEDAEAQ